MERLTREDLRQMAIGETKEFRLPDAQAIDNAGTTAYQLQNVERCKYSVSKDYQNNVITITNNAI